MCPKDTDGIANSVDNNQTAPLSSLIYVYTVCSDLSYGNCVSIEGLES